MINTSKAKGPECRHKPACTVGVIAGILAKCVLMDPGLHFCWCSPMIFFIFFLFPSP